MRECLLELHRRVGQVGLRELGDEGLERRVLALLNWADGVVDAVTLGEVLGERGCW